MKHFKILFMRIFLLFLYYIIEYTHCQDNEDVIIYINNSASPLNPNGTLSDPFLTIDNACNYANQLNFSTNSYDIYFYISSGNATYEIVDCSIQGDLNSNLTFQNNENEYPTITITSLNNTSISNFYLFEFASIKFLASNGSLQFSNITNLWIQDCIGDLKFPQSPAILNIGNLTNQLFVNNTIMRFDYSALFIKDTNTFVNFTSFEYLNLTLQNSVILCQFYEDLENSFAEFTYNKKSFLNFTIIGPSMEMNINLQNITFDSIMSKNLTLKLPLIINNALSNGNFEVTMTNFEVDSFNTNNYTLLFYYMGLSNGISHYIENLEIYNSQISDLLWLGLGSPLSPISIEIFNLNNTFLNDGEGFVLESESNLIIGSGIIEKNRLGNLSNVGCIILLIGVKHSFSINNLIFNDNGPGFNLISSYSPASFLNNITIQGNSIGVLALFSIGVSQMYNNLISINNMTIDNNQINMPIIDPESYSLSYEENFSPLNYSVIDLFNFTLSRNEFYFGGCFSSFSYMNVLINASTITQNIFNDTFLFGSKYGYSCK